MMIQYICKFFRRNKDDALRYIINIFQYQPKENFNSLRLIKVKSPFEVDQEKCKWDLDLYSSTKESSHTSIKKCCHVRQSIAAVFR